MKEKVKRIKKDPEESKKLNEEDSDLVVTWDGLPINEKTIDTWIEDLRKYTSREKDEEVPLSITKWLDEKGLYAYTWHYNLKKFPKLKKVYDDVLYKLGSRALDSHSRVNFRALQHRLHTYGKEFVNMDEYQKKLKLEITEAIDAKLHTLSEEFIDTLKNMHGKI